MTLGELTPIQQTAAIRLGRLALQSMTPEDHAVHNPVSWLVTTVGCSPAQAQWLVEKLSIDV